MFDAALAGLLRSVERVVPPLEERERVLLRPQLRDPGRNQHPACRSHGLLGELGLEAPVELVRVVKGRLREDDRELVAPDAARHVGGTDYGADPVGDLGED